MVARVSERTDGVPLFAEELTQLMRDGDGEAIPATLRDSLAARLDRLGAARETAQLAAVVGREFAHDLIAAVSEAPEEPLETDLSQLADAEVIYVRGTAPDATYRFKHALIQDAAYESLLKSRRRALHGKVARVLTERFAAVTEAQPELLARHWAAAGETGPALAAWKSAGARAYARRAFAEAEVAYRQCLTLLDGHAACAERDAEELEITSALNRALQITHGYAAPETHEAAARARALAEKTGAVAALVREEGRVWQSVVTAGDYAGAAALADHILDLVSGEADQPTHLIFAHASQVQQRFYTGDLMGADDHFTRLSPLLDTVGARQPAGNNNVSIGVASLTAWLLGKPADAFARRDRARAIADASGRPYDLALALHFEGLAAFPHAPAGEGGGRGRRAPRALRGQRLYLCRRPGPRRARLGADAAWRT